MITLRVGRIIDNKYRGLDGLLITTIEDWRDYIKYRELERLMITNIED